MSFFKTIENWWTKVFHGFSNPNLPAVFHNAASAIQLVAPGLVYILQLAGQKEASAEVTKVANEVTTDLGVLSQLFVQGQTGVATVSGRIVAILEDIKANLQGLLAAGHIKNADTIQQVTNAVNAFIAEAEVVIGMLPQA